MADEKATAVENNTCISEILCFFPSWTAECWDRRSPLLKDSLKKRNNINPNHSNNSQAEPCRRATAAALRVTWVWSRFPVFLLPTMARVPTTNFTSRKPHTRSEFFRVSRSYKSFPDYDDTRSFSRWRCVPSISCQRPSHPIAQKSNS